MYFPGGMVTFNANTHSVSTAAINCATVIASTLTLGPSSGSSEGPAQLSTYSCNFAYGSGGVAFNTPMATVWGVRVVE